MLHRLGLSALYVLTFGAAIAGLSCSSGSNEDIPLDLGGDGASGGGATTGDGGDGSGTGAGAGSGQGGSGAGSGTSTGAGAGSGNGGNGAGAGSGTGANGAGAGNPGGNGNGDWLVYASTDSSLFVLDPTDPALELTKLGDFECVGQSGGLYSSMLDVAVDRFQHVWGVAGHSVIPLFPAGGTVHCGPAIDLTTSDPSGFVPTFYALTFAPQGLLDPLKEVLVAGNSAGELWSVDSEGHIALHGNFGMVPPDDGHGHTYDASHVGKRWELSGDIVFLANDGDPVGFATVRDCPDPPSSSGCSKHDTLIEIDMQKLNLPEPGIVTKAVRGKIVKKIGCGADGLVAGQFFGIAAWNDAVFGFSRTGGLVRVLTGDASGCLVKNYPTYKFSGAGVTTLAPIDVPPLQ